MIPRFSRNDAASTQKAALVLVMKRARKRQIFDRVQKKYCEAAQQEKKRSIPSQSVSVRTHSDDFRWKYVDQISGHGREIPTFRQTLPTGVWSDPDDSDGDFRQTVSSSENSEIVSALREQMFPKAMKMKK
jgi:hypothetical protein